MNSRSLLLFRGLQMLFMGFFKTWSRMSVQGRENVPETGGFILAPGAHRSILDTGVVGAATPRIPRFMGAEKYFEVPILGSFLRSTGGFPVEREMADRKALQLSEEILRSGDGLVIFPEATRYSGPLVQPLKEGAAFLACRAQVPIVPVAIGGGERAWPIGGRFIKPTRMALIFGEPIYPPEPEAGQRVKRSAVREMTAELQEALQTLFDEAQIKSGAA